MNQVDNDFWLATPECGVGWSGIIERTNSLLSIIDPDYRIDQIKEKFGGLRYYFTPSFSVLDEPQRYNAMQAVEVVAMVEASRTCEMCGDVGNRRGYEVRCDAHREVT